MILISNLVKHILFNKIWSHFHWEKTLSSHKFPVMVKVLTTHRQLRAFLHAPQIPKVAMNRMTPPAATMTMARPSARSAALKLPTDSVFIRGTTFWST